MIGEMLAKNQSIEELILKENKPLKDVRLRAPRARARARARTSPEWAARAPSFCVLTSSARARDQEGAIAIAKGLAGNTTLLQIDLMGMPKLGMSERVLTAFIDMYATNFHLKRSPGGSSTLRKHARQAHDAQQPDPSTHRPGQDVRRPAPGRRLRGTGVAVKGAPSTAGADGKPPEVAKAPLVPRRDASVPARRRPRPRAAPPASENGGGRRRRSGPDDGAAVEDSNMALVGSRPRQGRAQGPRSSSPRGKDAARRSGSRSGASRSSRSSRGRRTSTAASTTATRTSCSRRRSTPRPPSSAARSCAGTSTSGSARTRASTSRARPRTRRSSSTT